MHKMIFPCVAIGALALSACSPSTAVEDPGTGGGGGGGGGGALAADTSAGSIYGSGIDGALTMNNLTYDEENDELIINNLPFDGVDGRYEFVGMLAASGFARYENVAGTNDFYAVFARSGSGYSQVASVATDNYIDFGFGGAQAKRLNNRAETPPSGEYIYVGDYAATRSFEDGAVQYLTGSASLEVDIDDFDVTGAVDGSVGTRTIYATDGSTVLGTTEDVIIIPTSAIDFSTATIPVSGASSRVGDETLLSGSWAGVFTGPNGEEIAGIIILTGPESTDEGAPTTRETGVFIVEQTVVNP